MKGKKIPGRSKTQREKKADDKAGVKALKDKSIADKLKKKMREKANIERQKVRQAKIETRKVQKDLRRGGDR